MLSENGKLLGKLSIHAAIESGSAPVKKALDSQPIVLYTDEPLDEAMRKSVSLSVKACPLSSATPVLRWAALLKGAFPSGD